METLKRWMIIINDDSGIPDVHRNKFVTHQEAYNKAEEIVIDMEEDRIKGCVDVVQIHTTLFATVA